jgi:hypothetical protein
VSLLSHDRYQYDSLILSKQTWACRRQHLQQLLWCVVSVRLNLPEVEERKLCLWYTPTRRNHKQLSLGLLHNVESVYFFYSNPVYIRLQSNMTTFIIPLTGSQFRSFRPTSGHRYTRLKTMVICSAHWFHVIWDPIYINDNTVIPWLTSDPANEFFG